MKPTRFFAATLVLAALAAAWAGGLAGLAARARAGDEPAAGNPAKGKSIFEKNCVPCHRKNGTGGIKVVATGNPSRNFTNPEFWKGRTDAQLQKSIESGFPKSGMISWKGVLRPHEIRDVIAYLRASFQPKHAREAVPPADKGAAAPGEKR